MTQSTKKRYTKPRITAQGSVDEITLGHNQDYGPTIRHLWYWHPGHRHIS